MRNDPHCTVASRLLLLAVPMIFFPSFLLYTSETSSQRRNALTPLEQYLCTNSGILLVTVALALLFNVSMPSVYARICY